MRRFAKLAPLALACAMCVACPKHAKKSASQKGASSDETPKLSPSDVLVARSVMKTLDVYAAELRRRVVGNRSSVSVAKVMLNKMKILPTAPPAFAAHVKRLRSTTAVLAGAAVASKGAGKDEFNALAATCAGCHAVFAKGQASADKARALP